MVEVPDTETKILPADAEGIAEAAAILLAGGLVAFPTETVYGLGALASSDAAVARIFAAKERPSFNPLIAHVSDFETAEALCFFNDDARRLAHSFWPGPLTLVLPMRPGAEISGLVTAGGQLLAIRVPTGELATALLRATGRPVAAPSANPSGRISSTSQQHVVAGLGGKIDAVLDGGECRVGVESTIVGFENGPELLRSGGLPAEVIEECLGRPLTEATATERPASPGQLTSHYAPQAELRLNADEARPGEFLIGFGAVRGDISLSVTGDLVEAAANLFSALHLADASGQSIAVAPVPSRGLGLAINDRLHRAAAPRD